MITDLFIRRYRAPFIFSDHVPPEVAQLFVQAAQIIFDDMPRAVSLDRNFFQNVHDALARELAVGRLFNATKYDEICGRFLIERYDLWNGSHRDVDYFVKARISLIELIFRRAEERWGEGSRRRSDRGPLQNIVDELNRRFRDARLPLHYHNGLVQLAEDGLSTEKIAAPCWEILRDARWASAERELKEALDRADTGHSDAAFHAAKSLESVIKIISDDKGWTTGHERGAANYIDNLASQKNGRFVDLWEAELLKNFFSLVRNPQGHGAGNASPVILTSTQTTWVIENCMSWIKSLVRRPWVSPSGSPATKISEWSPRLQLRLASRHRAGETNDPTH